MSHRLWPGAEVLPAGFTGTEQDVAAVAAGGRGKPKGGYLFLPSKLAHGAFLKWLAACTHGVGCGARRSGFGSVSPVFC